MRVPSCFCEGVAVGCRIRAAWTWSRSAEMARSCGWIRDYFFMFLERDRPDEG